MKLTLHKGGEAANVEAGSAAEAWFRSDGWKDRPKKRAAKKAAKPKE